MISYLITDPTHHYKSFQKADFVCYRDKDAIDFEAKAEAFVTQARQEGISHIFLNEHFSLASKLGATGVHLTSKQFGDIKIAKEMGLEIIISCHTESDIKEAIEKGADYVTYSPIYDTPNKGEPKGIENLKKMVLRYNVNIIALGGIITKKQLEEIEATGAYGFASIRYFKDIDGR